MRGGSILYYEPVSTYLYFFVEIIYLIIIPEFLINFLIKTIIYNSEKIH